MTAAHRRLLARLRAVRGARPAGLRTGARTSSRRCGPTCTRQTPSVAEAAPGVPADFDAGRAARDGQGSRGALRVRGRARRRGAGRARRGAARMRGAPVAAPPPAGATAGSPPAAAAWRTAVGARSWSASPALLAIAAVVAIVSLVGSDDPGTDGGATPPASESAASSRRPLRESPPTGAAGRRCRRRARTWTARCSTGRSGWWAASARAPAPRTRRGLRPRDQRLEVGSRPAGEAAPRDGRDVQGRAGRDRRVDTAGIRPERAGLRPRVRAARREVGAAAAAAPPARGRRGSRGRRQDRRDGRPGRGPPAAHHGGVRRQASGTRWRTCRRRASTSRRSRTATTCTRWAGARSVPTRTPRRSSATTPPPTAGSALPDMPTARGGLGAAIAGGQLFAVGGESPTRAMGEVESYSIARRGLVARPDHAHPPARARRSRRSATRSTRSAGPGGPGTPAPWTTQRSPGSPADPVLEPRFARVPPRVMKGRSATRVGGGWGHGDGLGEARDGGYRAGSGAVRSASARLIRSSRIWWAPRTTPSTRTPTGPSPASRSTSAATASAAAARCSPAARRRASSARA